MKPSGLWKALWALMACLALCAAPWLPAAEAHAMLLLAYPAPGETLDATPVEIRLTFSERIGLGSTLQLFGPQFRAVPAMQSWVDPAAPQELRAFPPQLSPDTYTVEWSAISADGHAVSGSYAFAVKPPAAPASRPSWGWLLLGGGIVALAAGGGAWELARRRRVSQASRGNDASRGDNSRDKGA